MQQLGKMWDRMIFFLPQFLWAVIILIVGWIVALFISKCVGFAVSRTALDRKISTAVTKSEKGRELRVEMWISKGVYYFLLLIVLAAFFKVLGLEVTSETLSALPNQVFNFLPRLCVAFILAVIAWVIATFLHIIIAGGLNAINFDEKFASQAEIEDEKQIPVGRTIADAIYWLIFLLFVPFILDVLGLRGLLEPIQTMFTKVFQFIPNLLLALFVLITGWLIARLIQKVITNFLLAAGSEDLSDKAGLKTIIGQKKLAQILGLIVYVLVLIPVLITTLEALQIESVTLPFREMLSGFMGAIPSIFAAICVLGVSYIAGSILAQLTTNVFGGFGFNSILGRLGLGTKDTIEGALAPAEVLGKLVHVGIMFLAAMVACELLNFETLASLIFQFLLFAGDVIIGVIIFMIGLYLSNLAAETLKGRGAQSDMVALLARVCIIVFSGAMALRHIGLAQDIINLTFGLLLGAIAVAGAIAFGVGGRAFAARKLEEWEETIKSQKKDN